MPVQRFWRLIKFVFFGKYFHILTRIIESAVDKSALEEGLLYSGAGVHRVYKYVVTYRSCHLMFKCWT